MYLMKDLLTSLFTFSQGCDDFTHNFLRKLGVRIHNPENIPGDPYTDHRKQVIIFNLTLKLSSLFFNAFLRTCVYCFFKKSPTLFCVTPAIRYSS